MFLDRLWRRRQPPSPSRHTTHVRGQERAFTFRPSLEALEDRTLPATIYWINPGGGLWQNPSNWSTGMLPRSFDDVVIDIPDITVRHPLGSDSIHSLTSGRNTLVLSGGSLAIADASVMDGNLNFSNGTLMGPGDLTILGSFNWTRGTMSGSGHTRVGGAATISYNQDFFDLILDGRTLDNAGTLTWTGTRDWQTRHGAVVNNLAGATFDVHSNVALTFPYGDAGVFNNQGTFRKSAGGATSRIDLAFNNRGTVEVQAGTLSLTGGGLSTGTFLIDAGATINLQGDPYTLDTASVVTGDGTMRFSLDFYGHGSTDVAGTYTVSNTQTGGAVNFISDVCLPNLTLGGTVTGRGNLTVENSLIWRGILRGSGQTRSNGQMVIDTGGSNPTLDGRTLDIAGTVSWMGDRSFPVNGAVINNLAGAVFDVQNSAGIETVLFGKPSTFNNQGTFRKSAGSNVATVGLAFNNSGTVEVAAGTLKLSSGGVSSGTFVIAAGTLLDFGMGTHTLTSDSALTGEGDVRFSGDGLGNGIFNLMGAATLTGHTTITSGTVNFLADVSLPTLTLAGGRLSGRANLSVAGLLNWTGGTMTGPGRTRIGGTMLVNRNDSFYDLFLDRVLENAGTITWRNGDIFARNSAALENLPGATFDVRTNDRVYRVGPMAAFHNFGLFRKSTGGITQIDVSFSNSGTVELQTGKLNLAGPFLNFANQTLTGGTYRIRGALQFTHADIVTNAATLLLDGSAAAVLNESNGNALTNFATNAEMGNCTLQNGRSFTSSGAFQNAGQITIGTGSTFLATGVYTQTAGTTALTGGTLAATSGVTLEPGSSLTGAGLIRADVLSAGEIIVGGAGATGVLTINGNYTQTPTGILDMKIGGLQPGDQYDQMNISGTATLDGTLNISLINDFSPSVGNSFQIMAFVALSGNFAATNGLDLGNGLFFDPSYADSGLSLVTKSN